MKCTETHASEIECDIPLSEHGRIETKSSGVVIDWTRMHTGVRNDGKRVFWDARQGELYATPENTYACREWQGPNKSFVEDEILPLIDDAHEKCIARGISFVFAIQVDGDLIDLRHRNEDSNATMRLLHALVESNFNLERFVAECVALQDTYVVDFGKSSIIDAWRRK